jgi:beta-phosphoglucomutase-like phosphatase (HAD superfamily)
MTPDLVIFDCDGVLVDSETISNELLAQAVTELGWPTTTADSHQRFRGRSMMSTMAIIEAEIGRPIAEDWAVATRTKIRDAVEATVTAIPGVQMVVETVAAADLPRCVGSSSGPDYLQRVLARTGLGVHFGADVFSAHMVENGKPAPDLFLFAASQMGHPPQAAVVIEDTVPGVEAGMAAGMRVIGFAGDPHTDADALKRAGATVVRDMAEVPDLLGL